MRKLTKIERKKRSRKNFFRFIILIILISFTVLFSFKSKYFEINNFKIKGNKKLTNSQIINSSMINIGENIFRINKKEAINNLKKKSYIKNVDISRKLPDTIEIDITERKAILFIQKLSSFLLIDEEGIILEQKDNNEEQLPVFIGLDTQNVNLGDNMFSTKLNSDIIDLIYESLNLNIINLFDKVDLKTKDEINIFLKDGIYVAFGTLDNVKYKLGLLNEILKDTKEKDIKFTKIIMNKGENPILVTED